MTPTGWQERGSWLRKIGGLGAPDFIKYYYASHLRVLTSWTARKAPNRWAEIEMSVTAPVHPRYMLWPSTANHMLQLRSICLAPMLFTLSIWKRCSEHYSLSFPCPPLLNVLFNPDIPDSLSYDRMLAWTQAGIFQLRQLVNPVIQHFLSFSDLKKHQSPKTLFYSYLQFRHFFSSRSPSLSPSLSLEKPSDFELLCARGPYEPQLISAIYKIQHEAIPTTIVIII